MYLGCNPRVCVFYQIYVCLPVCLSRREANIAAREAHGEERRLEATRHEERKQLRNVRREVNIKAPNLSQTGLRTTQHIPPYLVVLCMSCLT